MTVTNAQVRSAINASVASVPDANITLALSVARRLVEEHVGSRIDEVPTEIRDRAELLVAVEQLNQDNAPNGVLNQAFADGLDVAAAPVRIGRDPMKPAYPLLSPWASGRFFCA